MPVTFEEMTAKKLELDALVKEHGEEALKNVLTMFFTEFPFVEQIHWTQYTPYFNDGDACTFGIGNIGVRIDPDVVLEYTNAVFVKPNDNWPSMYNMYIDPEADDYERYIDSPGYLADGPFKDEYTKLCSGLYANSELLKMTLGDHAEITCTPGQVEVTFYEHE